jgi:hypothetical protein
LEQVAERLGGGEQLAGYGAGKAGESALLDPNNTNMVDNAADVLWLAVEGYIKILNDV